MRRALTQFDIKGTMKKNKTKKLPFLCAFLLLAALAVCMCGIIFGNNTAFAATAQDDSSASNTYITAYDVSYNIKSNRTMTVTETVTISFDHQSYYTRLIPSNGGELIRNVKVLEVPTGDSYDVYVTGSYVAIDLGGRLKTTAENTSTYTYKYSYVYCLTRAQEGANVLALTPLPADVECRIENITLSFTLPDGYVDGSADCWYGSDETAVATSCETTDGKVTVTAAIESIPAKTEVRIDFGFEDGALSTYFDSDSYIFIIAAVIVIAVLLAVKFLFFNKSNLTPIINIEAPNKMDPLMMGKLIDNKVNSEDITSMIFYWADKGYLKISLDDEDDPTLIRIVRTLPDSAPEYEQTMFYNLFKSGDSVKCSELKYRFYTTVNIVTQKVNMLAKNLYNSKSVGVSIIFVLLAGCILGLAPLIVGMFTISSALMYYNGFVSLLGGLVLYALAETVAYNRLKISGKKTALFAAGIAILAALFSLIYCLFIPSLFVSTVPKIILCALCFAAMPLSVCIISRTKDYTEKLNDIVGFRNYILYAEKDQLEAMLEENPQFYYHILPYAQVLNVTDAWDDKFSSLTVAPPAWATGNVTALEFVVYCSLIRNMRMRTARAMVSRPPSAAGMGAGGRSGGGHGSFGGHGGGGHGGGGIRFR